MIAAGIDNTNAVTIALSCMSNVGPTLGTAIGPVMSWSTLRDGIKWVCSFDARGTTGNHVGSGAVHAQFLERQLTFPHPEHTETTRQTYKNNIKKKPYNNE